MLNVNFFIILIPSRLFTMFMALEGLTNLVLARPGFLVKCLGEMCVSEARWWWWQAGRGWLWCPGKGLVFVWWEKRALKKVRDYNLVHNVGSQMLPEPDLLYFLLAIT